MVWMLLISTVLLALAWMIAWQLVYPDPPPRWRVWLGSRLARMTGRQRGQSHEPDPFEVLRVQTRLGVVAGQIRELEAQTVPYARAHRLVAVRAAYDDLLDEACELAGVPTQPDTERGEARRWYEERQLAERGWSW